MLPNSVQTRSGKKGQEMRNKPIRLDLSRRQAMDLEYSIQRAIEELELDIRDDLEPKTAKRVLETIRKLGSFISDGLRQKGAKHGHGRETTAPTPGRKTRSSQHGQKKD